MLKTVKGPTLTKLKENLYEVSGDFGFFSVYGGDFYVQSIYLKAPAEHYVHSNDLVLWTEILSSDGNCWLQEQR